MNAYQMLAKTIEKIEGAYAPSTLRAYRTNFERFIKYCMSIERSPLPANPIDVGSYIAYLGKSGLKSASIRLAVSSISSIHILNDIKDPTRDHLIVIEMRRMHRTLGRASRQALGITEPTLKKMLSATKADVRGLRDRALLLLAYDSLCRRGELVSLKLSDIEYGTEGLPAKVRLSRSKTDQEAIGKMISMTTETQLALKKWIECIKAQDGSIFRGIKNNQEITGGLNAGQINRIYKGLARKAGLPENMITAISGHSFRVGAAQDLLDSGINLLGLMHKGRWSKPETAMRYVELYQSNPVTPNQLSEK